MTERIVPGFASAEVEVPEEEQAELPVDFRKAYYNGVDDQQAGEIWKSETLCGKCIHAPVCKHFEGMGDALISVSRCLAYIPAPKRG
jgi:hypothetical protein